MSTGQENWLFGFVMILALVAGGVAGWHFTWAFILAYSVVLGLVLTIGVVTYSAKWSGDWHGLLITVIALFLFASWVSWLISYPLRAVGVFR